jgi:predicted nucleic acid-binding protein
MSPRHGRGCNITSFDGVSLAERYGFTIYDAMVVAADPLGDCDALWSEDMQHGITIDGGPRIVNPFRIA